MFVLLLVLFCIPSAFGQTADADTSRHVWRKQASVALNGAQTAFHNWAQGGLNALALSGTFQTRWEREDGLWAQTHEGRLGFGIVKQDTLDLRKSDDQIRLDTQLRYRGQNFFAVFQPTIALTFRSQFAAGFNYERNPFRDGRRPPVKVSDFFAPATFQQSVGLSYRSGNAFRQRVGLAGQQVVVTLPRLRTLYNVDADKVARIEAGLESRTEVNTPIAENVRYRSELGFFLAFNREVPDLTWDHNVEMRVNSWLTTNLQVQMVYDRSVSSALQLKEVLSLGVRFRLI